MKKLTAFLLLLLFYFTSIQLYSQSSKPYNEGTLWQVNFLQVKAGMAPMYIKNLSENWVKAMRQAKTDGLIMDFKVLEGTMSTKDDWNMMLMYQIKNYAALDGLNDKMEAIRFKLMGNEEAQMKGAISRNDMRQMFGSKLTQEMIFK